MKAYRFLESAKDATLTLHLGIVSSITSFAAFNWFSDRSDLVIVGLVMSFVTAMLFITALASGTRGVRRIGTEVALGLSVINLAIQMHFISANGVYNPALAVILSLGALVGGLVPALVDDNT